MKFTELSIMHVNGAKNRETIRSDEFKATNILINDRKLTEPPIIQDNGI